MDIHLIVAIGENDEIGKAGDLIWHIPEDLKRFKAITMGHPVIMGRKTWESLPKKPLPGRSNIILTRNKDYKAEGGEVLTSIEEVIGRLKDEDVFIIGGAEIYKAFLPFSTSLDLTRIEERAEDADTFLDLKLDEEWEIEEKGEQMESKTGVKYRHERYKRRHL